MKLFNTLINIKNENLISFHVPGHKHTELYNDYFKNLNSILEIDVTEIPGTDNLHSAETCILESQKNASELYNTKQSFFLVNGTTSGIYAMIMASTSPRDKIIVSRDCHRAVFDAIQLGDLNAVYITPEIDSKTNLVLGMTEEKITNCINKNKDAKAIVLTYPNYNGICCDILSIEKIVHKNNMLLLVDEAHGAHLLLDKRLPISSIEAGADIIVHSSHKSLPVFTQASMLHLNSDRINIKKLKYMLKLHQTSSPSYLLMSSLDIGISIIKDKGKEMADQLISNILNFKKSSSEMGYFFLEESDLNKKFKLDITKLTLLGKKSNLDPIDVEEKLRDNGIQIEFSTKNNALFITSICNIKDDFTKLSKSLEKAEFKCYSGIDNVLLTFDSITKLSIKDSFYSNKKKVLLKESINLISSNYIMPYPPGIPILIPGELIDNKKIYLIKNMIENNQKIIGTYEKYSNFDNFYIEVVTN